MSNNPPGMFKLLAVLFAVLMVAIYLGLTFVQWIVRPSKRK